MAHEKTFRAVIMVEEDMLTGDGDDTIEQGWKHIEEELKGFLATRSMGYRMPLPFRLEFIEFEKNDGAD